MSAVQDLPAAAELIRKIAGRRRVAIEDVRPRVDDGRFAAKRVIGESVVVEADVFTDGHDLVSCRLLYRWEHEADWAFAPMEPLGNDRWRAEFPASNLGCYRYTIEGWVDHLQTWQADLRKRVAAGHDVAVDIEIGARFVEEAAQRANGPDAERLRSWLDVLRHHPDPEYRKAAALHQDLLDIARRYPDWQYATRYEKELTVAVEREKALFSAWYELFPRSFGTLRDAESWLPYVASMGFDVLYLPPIHPIGRAYRKGKNNQASAGPDDVGSPWAIGAAEGGHKSLHPELGTLDDFRRLMETAKSYHLEVALDLAYQASADHPYVRDHAEWFRRRPDGTIQYAENPPKKYQDIYPFDFESEQWTELWEELKSVAEFWIEQGIRIFRVDNPHTKPFSFWEWLIAEIRKSHPDVIFLAEAFTRPKVVYRLAKLGFSQSYSYFAWRNTQQELTEYFTELAEVADFFRPNLWPNTPDILTALLQSGGRPAFMVRAVLAATLSASWGIYGPAFELAERVPREPGSEEYLNSEKYEKKAWDLHNPGNLHNFISRINQIRRENSALHKNDLQFHLTDNPMLLCYSKSDHSNVVVTVVNLDPAHKQWGFVNLDLPIDLSRPYQAIDLLNDETYTWQGSRNYIELTPEVKPAHILRLNAGA
jgi:starch synthase (maltosyl-transferring)